MKSGQVRRLVIVGLAALALLASSAAVASAKLGGFHEGFFSRNGCADDPNNDLCTNARKLIDVASASGASIARFNVLWCQLEPTNDNFPMGVWNRTVENINAIVDSGMRPLPILINAPVWARAPEDRPDDQPQPPYDPQKSCFQEHERRPGEPAADHKPDAAYPPGGAQYQLDGWDQFVSRFIKCMQGLGNAAGGCPADVTPPAGNLETNTPPIQGYEIWNEPNLGKYWGKAEAGVIGTDDADRFTRLLRGAFAVPHARPVVLGGLSFPNFPNTGDWDQTNVAATRYLGRVYNLSEFRGDPPQFNAIGIHPYGRYMHTNAQEARLRYNAIWQVVREDHNDPTTQIWVTEVGDQGCAQEHWDEVVCPDRDPDLQASRLVNMWTGPNNIALPVPVIVYYRLMDSCPVGPCVRDIDTGRRMGVFGWRNFDNPRPAYCRLAAQWGAYPSDCG